MWRAHLRQLAAVVAEALPREAERLLGPDAAAWLLAQLPAGVNSHGHLQLLEHLLCEAMKVTSYQNRTSKKRYAGSGTPDATWRDLLNAAEKLLKELP